MVSKRRQKWLWAACGATLLSCVLIVLGVVTGDGRYAVAGGYMGFVALGLVAMSYG